MGPVSPSLWPVNGASACGQGRWRICAIIVDPASAEDNKTKPVGTGPFAVTRWTKGDSVVLTRRDDYWGSAPALKTVTFKFIPDASAQVAAVASLSTDTGRPSAAESSSRTRYSVTPMMLGP